MNTYYTKCGRTFQKSSTAAVTGYKIDEADEQCKDCPFQIEVRKGWPTEFSHWECRAGSQEPNHKNEFYGSVNDKLTLSVYSLYNDFLESVLEFCNDHKELSASYNQDREDCRRCIS